MSAIAEQMAATLATLNEQVPDSLVTCTHYHVATDGTGTETVQVFTARRGNLTSRSMFAFDGRMPAEAYDLVVNWAAAVASGAVLYTPEDGERVMVRKGDAAGRVFVVRQRVFDETETVLRLTVEAQYQSSVT
jgi:hypothetical protein